MRYETSAAVTPFPTRPVESRQAAPVHEIVPPATEGMADEHPGGGFTHKLADVVNATYEQYGTDAQMVAHVDDPRIDRAKVCTITLSLYERIMAWPPADSSALIRVMTQVE